MVRVNATGPDRSYQSDIPSRSAIRAGNPARTSWATWPQGMASRASMVAIPSGTGLAAPSRTFWRCGLAIRSRKNVSDGANAPSG